MHEPQVAGAPVELASHRRNVVFELVVRSVQRCPLLGVPSLHLLPLALELEEQEEMAEMEDMSDSAGYKGA